jgi:hypothetical protein
MLLFELGSNDHEFRVVIMGSFYRRLWKFKRILDCFGRIGWVNVGGFLKEPLTFLKRVWGAHPENMD